MDAYEIMKWPLSKVYEYMAFYTLENKDSAKSNNGPPSFEELCRAIEQAELSNNG